MATSGSYNYNDTRNDIIKDALITLGVVGIEESVDASHQAFAERALNRMIKAWQKEGIQLWNRREATIFTAKDTASYNVGPTGNHATNSYVSTTLSAAEASGQTVLSVTSSTGMTAADNVGIELDDGTRQWTTIASVDSSTQITVDDALTSGGDSGATVVAYTTKMQRPLRIASARREDLNNNTEVPLWQIRAEEYFEYPSKTASGLPTAYYYDKQLDNGVLYVWARPDDVDVVLNITYHESIEDFDTATDNPDFPQEWLLALVYGLAEVLLPAYGKHAEAPVILQLASKYKERCFLFDTEEASLIMVPQHFHDGRGTW